MEYCVVKLFDNKKLRLTHAGVEYCENGESVKNFNAFGKSALFLLTAPTIPQEVRDRADALAEAGEDVSVKTIKKLKADYESERHDSDWP